MSPEEFRRYGHRLIDWLADYHESLADAAGDGQDPARRGPRRPARRAAAGARGFRRGDRGSRPRRPARLVALAASAFLRLLPRQRAACRRPRRSRLDRARRARALVAVEPGGDRGRRGGDRLAAPDARPLAGLERRHPGHRLDLDAGCAHLRPRARHGLRARARRPAGRNANAARLRVGARPQLGRQGRASRRLRPRQFAARPVRRSIRDARRRAGRDGRRRRRERRPPVRHRRDRRHDGDDGDRSGRGYRGGRAAPRRLAACRRGDGRAAR